MNSRSPYLVVPMLKGTGATFENPSCLRFARIVKRRRNRNRFDLSSTLCVGRSDERSTVLQRRMTESILHRVAAGDHGAMRECIDRFGGLVWALAKRTVPAEAEDAVQDIFLDLWKSSQRYTSSLGSETTFVAMIARRRLIDRLRKSESRSRIDTLTTLARPDAIMPSSNEDISQEMTTAAKALASLPVDQQRVLRLAVERSMTHEQIAVSTGLPLGTVKTHVRRGLMHIRSLLNVEKAPARVPDVQVAQVRRAVS